MKPTRKSVAKIGIKDIERVWKDRAKGARIILTDRTCPGLELITNADSQSWVRPYRLRGVDPTTDKRFPMTAARLGSPGLPAPGYKMKVIDENTGREVPAGSKGVLVLEPPLPPGCLSTIWRDDDRYVHSYFSHFRELLYSSLDWAIRDADGYTFILGRTDDVINVSGHRLGTREIEESVAGHPAVAEAAVIGIPHAKWGERPLLLLVKKPGARVTGPQLIAFLTGKLTKWWLPDAVRFVDALPRTASGKVRKSQLRAAFADLRLPAPKRRT